MDANPPEVNSVQYHMEQKSALRVLPLNRADFVSAEQGAYEGGQWKPRRQLSGDEIFFGLRIPGPGAVVKVKLMKY